MKGRVRQSEAAAEGGREGWGLKNAGWGRKARAHARAPAHTRRGFVLKAPRWRDRRYVSSPFFSLFLFLRFNPQGEEALSWRVPGGGGRVRWWEDEEKERRSQIRCQ